MSTFDTNRGEIQNGAMISASHIEDLYNILSGSIREDVVISGSLTITGSFAGQIADLTTLSGSGIFYTSGSINKFTATSASIDHISSNVTIQSSSINHNDVPLSINGAVTASKLQLVDANNTASINTTQINILTGSFSLLSADSIFIISGSVFITGSIETTDPGVFGQLWRSGSYLMISTGSI